MISSLEKSILTTINTMDIPAEVSEVFELAGGFVGESYSFFQGRSEYRESSRKLEEENVVLHALCQVVSDQNFRIKRVKSAHLRVVDLEDGSEMKLSLWHDTARVVRLGEFDEFLLGYFRQAG